MTHICISKQTIIGSDNGLLPGRRQAFIWTNEGISLIGPLGTKFNEILIRIQTFSLKKLHLKTSSAKWRPSCLGLNVLRKMLSFQMGSTCWIWFEFQRETSSMWKAIYFLPLSTVHGVKVITFWKQFWHECFYCSQAKIMIFYSS